MCHIYSALQSAVIFTYHRNTLQSSIPVLDFPLLSACSYPQIKTCGERNGLLWCWNNLHNLLISRGNGTNCYFLKMQFELNMVCVLWPNIPTSPICQQSFSTLKIGKYNIKVNDKYSQCFRWLLECVAAVLVWSPLVSAPAGSLLGDELKPRLRQSSWR